MGNIPLPPTLILMQSNWIWTNESFNMAVTMPVGNRVFRKTIQSYGKGAVCAKVVLTTYVNSIHGIVGKILTARTLAQEEITPLPKCTLCLN